MYRVGKVLNHNTIIAITVDDSKEYLVVDKGIGFGRKVAERFEMPNSAAIYALEDVNDRGNTKELATNITPEILEIANTVLKNAEERFGKVDKSILFPMADHIEFAVKRLKNGESIRNPLTADIKMLFAEEYYVALTIVPLLKSLMDVDINEDEVGFITLHVHTAIENEDVSVSMQVAKATHDCVSFVEKYLHKTLDTQSMTYHRLMNHVRFMVIRGMKHEDIKLNINDYMETRFPLEFDLARTICDELGVELKFQFSESEIGYLAMHLQRVISDEQE